MISTMVGQCDLQKSDEGHREGLGVVSGSADCGECEWKLGRKLYLKNISRDNNNATTRNNPPTAK